MSNTTAPTPSESSALITQAIQATEKAKTALLKTFSFVPDDKLKWSPSPTARTALRIVAHCGAANGAFAALLRGDGWQLSMDPQEAGKQIQSGGQEIETREAAIESVETGATAVIAALQNVSPDQLDSALPTAFGPLPYRFCMTFPHEHMSGHARQIDYLETIWGDQDDHT